MRLCWYPEIFYSPCSPLDEGAGDAHRHRLCMNHRLPPSSSSLSLSTYLPSDDSNNNSWVNILFTVISGAFYPFLSEYRGGGMYFLFIFFAAFVCARCVHRKCDHFQYSQWMQRFSSVWPDLAPPLSIRVPNTKEVNPGALEGLFVQPVGVWFAAGEEEGSIAQRTRPCFDCPYCKA